MTPLSPVERELIDLMRSYTRNRVTGTLSLNFVDGRCQTIDLREHRKVCQTPAEMSRPYTAVPA